MAKTLKQKKSDKDAPPPRSVHSFWSGTISFGLVSVPVVLFPANRRTRVSFRLLDQDGTPLQRRYYCPEDETDVSRENIVRGYQLDDDQYVIVRDEELEAIEPRKSREIDLRRFVLESEISPMLFDRSYFLTPSGDTNKAYRLLAKVMQESGRAGIATFVMRDREYLIAILADGGILRAQTLRFEDEVRTPADVGLPPIEEPDKSEVSRLERVIQEHTAKQLDFEQMEDHYSERVRQLAEKKRKAGDILARPEHEQEVAEDDSEMVSGVDLLETIRQSLQQRNGTGSQNGKRHADDGLASKTKALLYEEAQELDIQGRSNMDKQQLMREIRRGRS